MERNKPVRIWETRQRPRREPKFHQIEMLEGVGRSISASLAALRRGLDFRKIAIRVFVVEYTTLVFRVISPG